MIMNTQQKWIVGVLALVVVAAGAWWLFGNQPASQNAGTLRIGKFSGAISYTPFVVAKNQGWFEEAAKKHNMTIEFTDFQSLPPINEALAADRIDIIFEAEIPATVGRAAGVEIAIAHIISQYTQEIAIPPNSPIKTANDLKGKKVAARAGSSSHYVLNKFLTRNGLTLNDIELIDMAPEDAKVAFETGQVAAWAVWSPFIEQEEVGGKGKALENSASLVQVAMFGRKEFFEANPALTQDLIDAIKKAQDWIVANPEEAQSIVAQELKLPIEVIKRAWTRHDFTPTIDSEDITDIQDKADFLFDSGVVRRRVNVEQELFIK